MKRGGRVRNVFCFTNWLKLFLVGFKMSKPIQLQRLALLIKADASGALSTVGRHVRERLPSLKLAKLLPLY
jgi:hypothetical protein